MKNNASVLVIGAGIVGVTSAFFLARAGYRVSVVDEAPNVALGTSFGNAGQLSYNAITPLASPSFWAKIPRIVLGLEPDIRIIQWYDPALWGWMIKFLGQCRADAMHKAEDAVLAITKDSYEIMEQLFAEGLPDDFDFLRNGKLVIYPDRQALQASEAGFAKARDQAGMGYEVWDRATCIARLPILANRKGDLVGGIFSPDDHTGDSHKFANMLRAKLEREYGVTFHFGRKVTGFQTKNDRIHAVLCGDAVYEADEFVMASGMGARALLKKVGVAVPLYPIKGYSLTLPKEDCPDFPTVSITDRARRLVFTPFHDRLRIAGLARFEGMDKSVDTGVIDFMKEKALEIAPALNLSRAEAWAGLRPYTPDSVPIIKRMKFQNLSLNIGHGMLGWTMALGSARRLMALYPQQKRQGY